MYARVKPIEAGEAGGRGGAPGGGGGVRGGCSISFVTQYLMVWMVPLCTLGCNAMKREELVAKGRATCGRGAAARCIITYNIIMQFIVWFIP